MHLHSHTYALHTKNCRSTHADINSHTFTHEWSLAKLVTFLFSTLFGHTFQIRDKLSDWKKRFGGDINQQLYVKVKVKVKFWKTHCVATWIPIATFFLVFKNKFTSNFIANFRDGGGVGGGGGRGRQFIPLKRASLWWASIKVEVWVLIPTDGLRVTKHFHNVLRRCPHSFVFASLVILLWWNLSHVTMHLAFLGLMKDYKPSTLQRQGRRGKQNWYKELVMLRQN